MSIEFITSSEATTDESDDAKAEVGLRPQSLEEYIGQDLVKQNVRILIDAAKKREEPIEHVLLHGSPGLGKTTLAHIIANELNANIRITSGPAIERAADLAAILTNLQEGDILFIDEIHRLHKTIEEILYPAMEDYCLDVVAGKGPAARTLRLELPKFTIIGATTRMSLIAAPLRDRFGVHYKLEFYNNQNMEDIVSRSANLLGIEINGESSGEVAKRSRRTPRIANRLLKRVRDYAQVHNDGTITPEIADAALDLLAVDEAGLNQVDRKILKTIIEQFAGGPVGLQTIAAATAEEISAIEEIHEPFLMQIGLMQRTPRGRMVTDLAYKHLDLKAPARQDGLKL